MNTRIITSIVLVGFVITAGWFVFTKDKGITQDLLGNIVEDEKAFFDDETINDALTNDITMQHNGEEETIDNLLPSAQKGTPNNQRILITDGVKHIVPLSDIQSGGPPKDGIPSIDHPTFVSIEEANKEISDSGLGISVSFNGINRFYPNQILVWHEIVNDIIGGTPALITYCPLCGTGIVFNPMVNGKRTEFGTSGKLWNSNLVMYDRQTQSYWSQALGKSIVGEQAGTKLELLPYQNLTYANWKKEYTHGEVLSTDTGFFRNYQDDPYGSYYKDRSLIFPVDNEDDRYHPKSLSYGIEIDNHFKVYPQEELEKSQGNFKDTFSDKTLNIEYTKDTQKLIITDSETGEEIIPVFGFWFSWISVHPDTKVYTVN